MTNIKKRLDALDSAINPKGGSVRLSESHCIVSSRFCSVGLHEPEGLRALVARMENETLTEQDKAFLDSLPPVEGYTHLSIAKLMIELDDEV